MPSDDLKHLLAQGADGFSPDLLEALPLPWRDRRPPAESYDMDDPALVAATQSALILGQPLVLAGEPGVGKTSFADALAERLDIEMHPPVRVKSTTQGPDLFCTFDDVARFREAAQPGDPAPLKTFVRFSGLGRAILWSAGPDARVAIGAVPPEQIAGAANGGAEDFRLGDIFAEEFRVPVLDENNRHTTRPVTESEPSLVLVDELDKAPRDAPNDVLGEVETMSFRIAELDLTIRANPAKRPILLITSNSERSFPDAFLRRCVFHWIDFPDEKRLRRIAAAQCAEPGTLSPNDALIRSSVQLFEKIRKNVANKKPATAELISFVSALHTYDYGPEDTVSLSDQRVRDALGILLKTQIDFDALERALPGEFPGRDAAAP